MTLLAAWFGSRMVVYGALLGWTNRFLRPVDKSHAEEWTYGYDPALLIVEHGVAYECMLGISKLRPPILFAIFFAVTYACWRLLWRRHGKPLDGKIIRDHSLE